jgi:hypothetical protein
VGEIAMGTYKGTIEQVNKSAREVYDFLSDFRHFEEFLPEQISGWEAGDDYCRFTVSGLGNVKLVYAHLEPHTKIVVQPASDSGFPVPFFLIAHISLPDNNPMQSTFQFVIEATLNPMMSMMVDGPLKKFVEIITLRLKASLNGETD